MKRSRSELVHAAVGSYLRKRQFSDTESFKKNELVLHETTQAMAMRGVVGIESSVTNCVGFSSISGDATAIDQHFTKLKSFIAEAVEPFKTQLTYILFPMFVHLYMELVCNGQKTPAQKFHHRHHGLFSDVQKYKELVEDLKNVVVASDLMAYPSVKAFRESKFILTLSDSSLNYLLRYLKDNDHLILLQIFNFHIEARDFKGARLHLFEEQKSDENFNLPSPEKTAESKPSPSASMKSLMQAIKKVKEGSPSLPSVCLYNLMNTAQGVSSVAMNRGLDLLAAGFENSAIQIWSLTPKKLQSEPTNVDVTRLRLACDDHLDEEESPAECKVMRGHCGPVFGLGFTSDSKLLLSCSEDTTVRAWDMATHKNVVIYRGHNYPVWDIDCCSLGPYFATASQDRTAKLWLLDRAYPVRTFAGHNMDVDSVRFHPNCNYVATGSSDRTVRLWSVQDGKMVRMFQGHRGSIFALAFSPSGQLLASAGEDRRIKIWDLSTGSLFKELRGHMDTVYSLCFNRDSSVLVSGGLDSHIRAWDIRKGVNNNTTADGHASPELLGSFVTKSTNLLAVCYSVHNLLVAVGTHPP